MSYRLNNPKSGLRALLTLVVLAGLLLRALVPSGFMTVADASGVHMSFCHGMSSQPAPSQSPSTDHHSHAGLCSFALGAGGALLPSLTAVVAPDSIVSAVESGQITDAPPQAQHRNHPPTGPPTLA